MLKFSLLMEIMRVKNWLFTNGLVGLLFYVVFGNSCHTGKSASKQKRNSDISKTATIVDSSSSKSTISPPPQNPVKNRELPSRETAPPVFQEVPNSNRRKP